MSPASPDRRGCGPRVRRRHLEISRCRSIMFERIWGLKAVVGGKPFSSAEEGDGSSRPLVTGGPA